MRTSNDERMKVSAITMVYKDYWALSQWYNHHGRQLGYENLFIVAHGRDDRFSELCPKASIITVPRKLDNFDRNRGAMLNSFQAGLLQSYDWVIRTDADELICHDPNRYGGLIEAITTQDAPVLTALGADLVGLDGDAAFSGHYSKAVASRRPIEFVLHGVKVAPRRLNAFPFTMPQGLYLAHLKYANLGVLDEVNETRIAVGSSDEPGRPGDGWRKADEDAKRFLDTFWSKSELPWETAEAEAYRTLSVKPSRNEKHSVVKTRALKLSFRTKLPAWFADLRI
ncbi:glycosyltransferase family 2 protein [Thalassococcus profundi]|uniref:Glycosyltransferase family 2 protein n=2 Tax=Thalassococcus profundi TaxID=2282382 RepID=A0A369TRW4_9RHOB|nr:glycosyltransferase family 2 protein [Thalassococcus profundi]